MNDDLLQFYSLASRYTKIDDEFGIFNKLNDDAIDLFDITKKLIIHPQKTNMEHNEKNYILQMKKERSVKNVNDIIKEIVAANCLQEVDLRNSQVLYKGIYSCPYISLLLCSLFRLKAIPVRMRVGLKKYSMVSEVYQHWIVEYFSSSSKSWQYIDADEGNDYKDCNGFELAGTRVITEQNNEDKKYLVKVMIYDLFCILKNELYLKECETDKLDRMIDSVINSNLVSNLIRYTSNIDNEFEKANKIYEELLTIT